MASLDWNDVTLGEVARLDIDRVPVRPTDEFGMAGLLIAGQGLFWRGSMSGSETAYQALHRLHAGQLVMRKLTAWEGPITTVPSEFDGAFVSSEFPTFSLDESRLLPEYMRLICQRPDFHAEMKMRSTGTAERRKRLSPGGLLAITVTLPSLRVQRGVVEALRTVDQAIAAYAAEFAASRTLLGAARADLLGSLECRLLDDFLIDIEAGKSPKAFDRPPLDAERGVLKVSAIRPGGFHPKEAKAVVDGTTFPDHAQVKAGDVLISRANTRSLVGATCRVERDFPALYLSDKTLRLIVDADTLDSDFLVHALAAPAARDFIEANATGTSESMKNISQKTIRATPLPYLEDVTRQADIARRLDAIDTAGAKAARLQTVAEAFRSAIREARSGEDRPRPRGDRLDAGSAEGHERTAAGADG